MPTIAIEQTGGRFAHPLVHRIRGTEAGESLPRAHLPGNQSGRQEKPVFSATAFVLLQLRASDITSDIKIRDLGSNGLQCTRSVGCQEQLSGDYGHIPVTINAREADYLVWHQTCSAM